MKLRALLNFPISWKKEHHFGKEIQDHISTQFCRENLPWHELAVSCLCHTICCSRHFRRQWSIFQDLTAKEQQEFFAGSFFLMLLYPFGALFFGFLARATRGPEITEEIE
jgi:hypothetical protein